MPLFGEVNVKSTEQQGGAQATGGDPSNPFDAAFDAFKKMRDTGLESWAKVMTQWVNTDAYAKSSGAVMDWYLTATAPFRQLVQKTAEQTLIQLNMPTRGDVINVAERLTHIEMALDDLAANLEPRRSPRGSKES